MSEFSEFNVSMVKAWRRRVCAVCDGPNPPRDSGGFTELCWECSQQAGVEYQDWQDFAAVERLRLQGRLPCCPGGAK